MTKEYVIYCDESQDKGPYFSNFYGGVLIRSDDLDFITDAIRKKKQALNLFGEVKWNKITENYAEKYIELLSAFFEFVADDRIKVRIMFTQNQHEPLNLSAEHREQRYFILYYQFLKHAFGLSFRDEAETPVKLRVYLDKLPDTREQVERFRGYLLGLNSNSAFKRANIQLKEEDIAEVISHDHPVLQCLDIVLGAMNFRLNDYHKIKPEGARLRGKRTRAKERVYRQINAHIQRTRANFNIGITTSDDGDMANRWRQPYRHWLFKPRAMRIIGKGKRKK